MNFNYAEIHLFLNHLPVLGSLFGFALLAAGLWRKSEELKKAALVLLVVCGAIAIPVYLTGEPSEEIVEDLPGVSEGYIEEHEESALITLIGIEATALVSLLGLILARNKGNASAAITSLCFILALAVSLSVAWTAHLGGQIRHTEIRSNALIPVEGDGEDDGEDDGNEDH